MKKELSGISAKIYELLAPTVNEVGCKIWDIDLVKEGARRILRVTIDAEGGVGIEDCERVHAAVDPLLDEADPIDGAYYLEISSPGIERDITLTRHIIECVGERVEVRLYAPLEGRRVYGGELCGMNDDGMVLIRETADGEPTVIAADAISKMKTVYDFGD